MLRLHAEGGPFEPFGAAAYDVDEAGRKPKKKYGHFPNDWMLGESCWPAFRDRVQAQVHTRVHTHIHTHVHTHDRVQAQVPRL